VQDTLLYTCGSNFATEEDPACSDEVAVVRRALNCNDPIESQYYCERNEDICCHCGQPASRGKQLIVDPDLSAKWCTVLPICETCLGQGKVTHCKHTHMHTLRFVHGM
jgi:hypothetical protein